MITGEVQVRAPIGCTSAMITRTSAMITATAGDPAGRRGGAT
ncbi:hypothetical protein [Quadrisphaera sp. DSM 44207]|nr:hypothetical protein [Quadrisphaera sp. DSM 44207]